jgi:hypothetical protein
MFTELLSLRLTNFTDALKLNAEKLHNIQVEVFSNFLRDFAINGTSFVHSMAFVCDNLALFRIINKESDVSAIGHLR